MNLNASKYLLIVLSTGLISVATSTLIFRNTNAFDTLTFLLFFVSLINVAIAVQRIKAPKVLITSLIFLCAYYITSLSHLAPIGPRIIFYSISLIAGLYNVTETLKSGIYVQKGLWKLLPSMLFVAMLIVSSNHVSAFGNYKLLTNNYIHVDVLFHASIIGMIKNYSITSTGINGVCETIYHDMFHRLSAATSSITTISSFNILAYMQSVVILPAMFSSFTVFVARQSRQQFNAYHIIVPPVVIFTFCCLARPFGFFDFFMQSESQCLAITMFVLFVTYVSFGKIELKAFIPTICAAILAISYTKGPVGIWAALAVGCWTLQTIRPFRNMLACLVVIGISLALGMNHFKGVNSNITFGLFPYLTGGFGSIGCSMIMEPDVTRRIVGYLGILAHFIIYYAPLHIHIMLMVRRVCRMDYFTISSLVICILMHTFVSFEGPNLYQITCIPVLLTFLKLTPYLIHNSHKSSKLLLLILVAIFSIQIARGIRGKWKLSIQPDNPKVVTLIRSIQSNKSRPKGILYDRGFDYSKLQTPISEFDLPFWYVGLSEHPWTGLVKYPLKTDYISHCYRDFPNSYPCLAKDIHIIDIHP